LSGPVVIDTNILFSALLKRRSRFAQVILTSAYRFYVNELVVTELFKHKEKIVRLSSLQDDEVIRLFYRLMRAVELFKEDLVSAENRKAAYALCHDIDELDTPHVAIALQLKALLWTGDTRLKEGLQKKGFDRFFEPE